MVKQQELPVNCALERLGELHGRRASSESVPIIKYCMDGEEPSPNGAYFISQCQKQADNRCKQILGSEEPVDASCFVMVSRDGMEAYAMVFPPIREGKALEQADLGKILKQEGITYGIQEQVLKRLIEGAYFQMAVCAKGTPPIHGEDGQVEDFFQRNNDVVYNYGEDEQADYKNLNWIRKVGKGDVICRITPPTEGTPGTTVKGQTVAPKPGRPASIPMGKNTEMSEDGLELRAAVDGQIFFDKGLFRVDEVLFIQGDVDTSVGNLDVIGDLVIGGDVKEGYIIHATENIVVQGLVEGADIKAGGSIDLKKGMNGGNRGTVEAGGDVKATFLENCNVTVRGNLYADSLINCKVVCSGHIEVNQGRGMIVGGSIMATEYIIAKVIGNLSHRPNTILIGFTPELVREKEQLTKELQEMRQQQEQAAKNVSYLERFEGQLTEEYEKLYKEQKLRLSVLNMKYAKAQKKFEVLQEQQRDLKGCYVKSSIIHPLTQITIGRETRTIDKEIRAVRVWCGPDGVTMSIG